MPDIATIWDDTNAVGDWVMDGPDLRSGSDLETAVLISWFSDRAADAADVIPDGSGDPRGWWGDDGRAYPIGSRLWTLGREKQLAKVLAMARDIAVQAVKWMLDDGVCSRIEVTAQFFAPGKLGLQGVFHQPGAAPVTLRYGWVWAGVN
jgi:phage gp46-like protein